MSARPLSELVEPGWAAALAPVADQVAQMGEFLRAEIAADRGYLPTGSHVLRAFTFPRVISAGTTEACSQRARGGSAPASTSLCTNFAI